METFKRDFINIIQAAFSEKTISISSDFDWGKALDLAKKHNIAPIIYYGAVTCEVSKDEKYMQELRQMSLRSTMVSQRQADEIEQLKKTFETENIAYMPLKGMILKSIYPKPEMRTMGDADILIRMEQYSKIESIMERLHFSFQYETDHELVWKKPTLFLELHKSIMTTYNKDFYRYFETGWKIAKSVPNSSRYEMSPEDFYLFAFVHFTKHYRISGIGVKHLIDLWAYANAHPNLNWAYIESELKKMHLSEFHTNVRNTVDVWFSNGTETDVTALITNVVFNSGQYGSAEMAIINRSLQKGNDSALRLKADTVVQSIFLPLKVMKNRYSVLNKMPILLPIMWFVRCIENLFHHKADCKRYFDRINQIDSAQIRKNQLALRVVGLGFEKTETKKNKRYE